MSPKDLPRYADHLAAVQTLDGSDKSRPERCARRCWRRCMAPMTWVRWTVKNTRALEQPARGVCSVTAFDRELLRKQSDDERE